MKGYIHSVESFGTVDGPGLRLVVFLQGCPLRCLYCHNPDTWNLKQGTPTEAADIIALHQKNKAFYANGGITVTGGEPLMQPEFLTELFSLAKQEGIHTCLDTSAAVFRPDDAKHLALLEGVLDQTDLVLLDIKHIDLDHHRALTGMSNDHILAFAKWLDEKGIPMWIRHTVVTGYTDDPDALRDLGRFIGTLRMVRALDVLPYHTMGVAKYKELGIDYPLDGVEAVTKEAAAKAREYILEGVREVRQTS